MILRKWCYLCITWGSRGTNSSPVFSHRIQPTIMMRIHNTKHTYLSCRMRPLTTYSYWWTMLLLRTLLTLYKDWTLSAYYLLHFSCTLQSGWKLPLVSVLILGNIGGQHCTSVFCWILSTFRRVLPCCILLSWFLLSDSWTFFSFWTLV